MFGHLLPAQCFSCMSILMFLLPTDQKCFQGCAQAVALHTTTIQSSSRQVFCKSQQVSRTFKDCSPNEWLFYFVRTEFQLGIASYGYRFLFQGIDVTGCSQGGGPKWGLVMGSRTWCPGNTRGKKKKIYIYIKCPHPHKSELGDGTHGAGPLKVVLNSNSLQITSRMVVYKGYNL